MARSLAGVGKDPARRRLLRGRSAWLQWARGTRAHCEWTARPSAGETTGTDRRRRRVACSTQSQPAASIRAGCEPTARLPAGVDALSPRRSPQGRSLPQQNRTLRPAGRTAHAASRQQASPDRLLRRRGLYGWPCYSWTSRTRRPRTRLTARPNWDSPTSRHTLSRSATASSTLSWSRCTGGCALSTTTPTTCSQTPQP